MEESYKYNYRYHYPKDGECSLENIKVWNRLKRLVVRTIMFTHWIKHKSFIEPHDILSICLDVFKADPTYNIWYNDITIIVKKIRTQIGREYWKYLRSEHPKEYEYWLQCQKEYGREYRKTHKYKRNTQTENFKKSNRESQKRWWDKVGSKNCETLSDSYLVHQVYLNFRYRGIILSEDEIRLKYPEKIEEKRLKLMKKRGINQQSAINEGDELLKMLEL